MQGCYYPNQMVSYPWVSHTLSNHIKICERSDVDAMAKVIFENLFGLYSPPCSSAFESTRYPKEKPIFLNLFQQWIPLSNTLMISRYYHAKVLSVQVYGHEILGSMTYKTVKVSQTLIFDLSYPGWLKFHVFDTVLKRTKLSVLDKYLPPNCGSKLQKVLTGVQRISALFPYHELKADPTLKLAPPPQHIFYHEGRMGPKLEWEERRYLCDLSHLIDFQKSNQSEYLSLIKRCEMIRKLVYTAEQFHKKGWFHGDIKTQNILILFNSLTQQYEGFLSDYEFVSPLGLSKDGLKYRYWDSCGNRDLFLPCCDVYGLAMAFGEMLFGVDFNNVARIRNRHFSYFSYKNTVFEALLIKNVVEVLDHMSLHLETTTIQGLRKALTQQKFSANLVHLFVYRLKELTKGEGSPEVRKGIADIEALIMGFDLLCEVFDQDARLCSYFFDDEAGQVMRRLVEDPTRDPEGYFQVMEFINKRFPVFSTFGNRVGMIEELWHDTVN